MTDEEHTLRMVKTQISMLPEDDQRKIEAVANVFRSVLQVSPDHGPAAIALIGAELAAQP